MLKKIIGWLFPLGCYFCGRRFRNKQKYHRHYLYCDDRLAAIAPRNRAQRRRMAKKAGQIKDWKKLNGKG